MLITATPILTTVPEDDKLKWHPAKDIRPTHSNLRSRMASLQVAARNSPYLELRYLHL